MMEANLTQMIWLFGLFVSLLLAMGFYCLLVTYNLLRVLIGMEILMKAVTLLIIAAGYLSGNMAVAQAMVITIIVIEVVVMVIAAGIVLGFFRIYDSLNVRNVRNLKG